MNIINSDTGSTLLVLCVSSLMFVMLRDLHWHDGIQPTMTKHACRSTDQQRTQKQAWFHQTMKLKNIHYGNFSTVLIITY